MLRIGTLARPGEPLTADKWNRLVLSIRRLLRLKTAGAISGTLQEDGLTLIFRDKAQTFLEARITAVIGASPGVPVLASAVTYTAKAVGMPSATITGSPAKGRPVHASRWGVQRIYAASVGDLCWIARNRQSDGSIVTELWLPAGAETLSVKICGT